MMALFAMGPKRGGEVKVDFLFVIIINTNQLLVIFTDCSLMSI